VVRHSDVEGGAVEVLRPGGATHGAIVLGAAIENGGAIVGHGSGGMIRLRAA